MRWRLILEEYGPELRYIKGKQNIVADALSRLDMVQDPLPMDRHLTSIDMAELYATNEDEFPKDFHLPYAEIVHRQKQSAKIKAFLLKAGEYQLTDFKFGDQTFKVATKAGKIILPTALQSKAVHWYHDTLLHPGETRMELTMGQHYTWEGMRKTIQRVCKRCVYCPFNKPKLKKMGHLPEKKAEEIPWERVCLDLIWPYTVGSPKKCDKITLHCMILYRSHNWMVQDSRNSCKVS